VPSKHNPHSPRPALRLVETKPPEPKWSGRRRIIVMIALGVTMWGAVAAVAWLLTRVLT
jgi:hypothetical protein